MKRSLSKFFILFFIALPSQAENDWHSFTIDNDLFVGNDNGYTNGLFYSLYETDNNQEITPSKLLKPLLWTLEDINSTTSFNAHTFGQIMATPSDITLENPPLDELPYAGVLFYTNTYLQENKFFADKLSTTIGIAGPLSLAEHTQTVFHDIFGSDEPQGWDTQLNNELIFQFGRGRAWRNWVSQDNTMDFVTLADLKLGTFESSVYGGFSFRYGKNNDITYPSSLLSNDRTINPVAIDEGWFFYFNLGASYTFNNIFTDGNTFTDSRSIDVDPKQISTAIGFAYSWKNLSVTFAINSLDIGNNNDNLENLTEYGTLTFLWRAN